MKMASQDLQVIFTGIIFSSLMALPGCHSQLLDATLTVDSPASNPVVNGFPSAHLSDPLTVIVGLQLGSAGDQIRLSLEIPEEFAELDQVASSTRNLNVTYGSNLQYANETVRISEPHLNVTFRQVEVISAALGNSSQENIIELSYPLYVHTFRRFGYLFNTTLSVEYGSDFENIFTSSKVLIYRGPKVAIETFKVVGGRSFVFDREMETSASFEIPPGSWNMSDTQVFVEFESQDVTFIDIDVFYCLAAVESPNITFSNPESQNVTIFDNTSSPIAYVTSQNASTTPGGARRRRATGVGSPARTTLTWNLFDITNIGDSIETVNFTVRGVIGQTADLVSGVEMTYTFTMELNQRSILLNSSVLIMSEPDLVVDKTIVLLNEAVNKDLDYAINYLRFTTTLSHSAQSTAAAYGVVFTDGVQGLILEYFRDLVPAFGTEGFTVTAEELVYEVDELPLGETLTISYKAYFSDDTVTNYIDASLMHVATATWHSMPAQEITTEHPGRSYGPAMQAETCVSLVGSEEQSLLYDHGLAALLFFVALVLGCIIVAIISLICIKCCKKAPYATVQPTGKSEGGEKKSQGLVMSSRGGAKSWLTALKDNSIIAIDDSIILILALKDKARKMLEFDNLDIWWTITIDVQLEQQRLDAMVDSITYLIHKWTAEGAIPKKIAEKCNKKFQRRVKDLNKTLDDEYKEECRELIKSLSAQNKLKLAELQRKHKMEYNNILTQTKGMKEEEIKEIMSLLRQQHEAERNEVMQLLKLQQDEQQEKVRKEIVIRKRLAVKSLQHDYLDEVILQSKLDEDAAMRLLREHRSNMVHLEAAMDDELSRQRMLLEEKLAKRRALAESNESLGDHNKQLLNTIATQTFSVITDLEEDDRLTEEQARLYTKKLRQEFLAVKAAYDKEKDRQEEGLHKRLSELKKRKLEERAREHKQQLDQFEREQKEKLENNNLDPSQYTEAKLNLLASQRTEMHELELSLDDEAVKQLEELQEELTKGAKEKIGRSREGFFKEMMSHGMTERMKYEILEQHKRDCERLVEEREEQRLKQEKLLKKRLAKHRQEWIKRKQEEKQEQQMIRDHEERVVGRVLASQLAISEKDRQRILDEHEKQQVALESSLALNKLRQRRLLEEKLVQRRARQMEKLQRRQNQETQREARKRQLADSDEEEGETQQELMKKQAEERIALLSADNEEEMEDELEAVRVEMMQAKVGALKEQEERLGALVAKLQLERSREIATIEEQQKALWQLKMNMLDNMTETGIIRNADCKKVIETHQKEAKNLENKLNAQREKQEKDFKRRLRDKLAEREQTFFNKQEEELQRLAESERNETSARLKRVALKHKHLMQMEEFRHSLEVEVSQALEDLKRQFEVERLKQLQEQELQFISGLVKHGGFSPSELRSVLFLLFPGKTQAELEPLLRRMYSKEAGEDLEGEDSIANGNLKGVSPQAKTGKSTSSGISLEEKIKLSILGNTSSSTVSTPSRERKRPNKLLRKLKKNKHKKLAPIADQDNQDHTHKQPFQGDALPRIGMARPEPVGRTATPNDSDIDRRGRADTDSEEERQPLKKSGSGRFGKSEYSY